MNEEAVATTIDAVIVVAIGTGILCRLPEGSIEEDIALVRIVMAVRMSALTGLARRAKNVITGARTVKHRLMTGSLEIMAGDMIGVAAAIATVIRAIEQALVLTIEVVATVAIVVASTVRVANISVNIIAGMRREDEPQMIVDAQMTDFPMLWPAMILVSEK